MLHGMLGNITWYDIQGHERGSDYNQQATGNLYSGQTNVVS